MLPNIFSRLSQKVYLFAVYMPGGCHESVLILCCETPS